MGLEHDTSRQGSHRLHWPEGRKMDFSVTEGRAELLNRPDVFSCVSPSPRLSKSSGWMDVSARFLRLFSQTYTLRGWLLSPHLSSPQEEGFVQRLSQTERQSLLILDQSLGPQVKQLSPFHLTDNVFSLRDWTGDFHQIESPAMTCMDVTIPGSETPAASQVAVVKNLPASARDAGSIPGLGRSPGEGHSYSLWYSCL